MLSAHSSSFLYCSLSATMTIVDALADGDEEADGGSEGNWGSLYSASLVPGYGPAGDLGRKGGEGVGRMKTGDGARGGGTSIGRRERFLGN